MTMANFANLVKIFRGGEPSAEERQRAYAEALLMVLARASHSDSYVSPVEVETVQAVMKRVTGEEVAASDIRVAAASELYETAPLHQYLGRVSRKLTPEERSTIVRCLAEVINSDVRVSWREVEFFDAVAHALKATPSEIAGLLEEG